MFVLAKTDQYSWPVHVEVPKSGGTWEKMSFDLTFKRLKQSEIKDLIEDPEKGDEEFCEATVTDWKGIVDEQGAAVPFSLESLQVLLNTPKVAAAIAKAYLQSLQGAPTKN